MPALRQTFEAGGRTWQFKFGFAALCRLEEEYDLPFARVLIKVLPSLSTKDMQDPEKLAAAALDMRIGDVLAVFMAGLTEAVTRDQVADIVDEIGLDRVLQVISSAFVSDVTGGQAGAGTKKPGARGASRKR